MTRPKRAPATSALSRSERPENLHPLISETYDVWTRSRMTATEASAEISVSRGTISAWLLGRGRPLLLPLDRMMLMVGHHYAIVVGARPGSKQLEPSTATNLRRHDILEDLHPLLVETDLLWRRSGVSISDGAAAIGMSRGPLYRWFLGTAEAGLLEVDGLLGTIGHRLTVARGVRPRNLPRIGLK